MQVNTIDFYQTGSKKTGSSKSTSSDDFGDILSGLQDKGSTDIMQLLAACGFMFPQTQQQTLQDGQNQSGQQQSNTQQDVTGSGLSVLPASVSGLSMQGLFSQGVVSQNIAPQYSAPQSMISQSGVTQNVMSQPLTFQSDILQNSIQQSVTPQNDILQGSITQNVTPQSNILQSSITQNVTPQSSILQGSITRNSMLQINVAQDTTQQGIEPLTLAEQAATLQSPAAKTAFQSATGTSASDYSFGFNVSAAVASSTPTTEINKSGLQEAAVQNFSAQATSAQSNILQSGQSATDITNLQQSDSSTGYQTGMPLHMIYGTRTFGKSYNTLTAGQTAQFSAQQPASSQSSVSAGSGATSAQPLVQQGTVQAAQANVFQTADSALSAKPLKADGDTSQVTDVQATNAPAGINAKGAAGTAQSDSKDTNSGTDSGSKHSGDSSAAQSVFGSVQASAIDAKNVSAATHAQKAEVADQLTSAVKQADENGRSQISLHLSPEDLGGINIKIVSQGGALSLQITADNSHTGQLIASGMHELTQAMHDAGLTMNKADVLFASNSGTNTSSGSQQQSGSQQSGGDTNYKAPKWIPVMQNTSSVSKASDSGISSSSRISILA